MVARKKERLGGKKLTEGISLLTKLIALVLAVVIVPVLIIGILATDISSKALQSQSKNSRSAVAAQTADIIDREIERFDNIIYQLDNSPLFREAVKYLEPKDNLSTVERAKWNLERMSNYNDLDQEVEYITVFEDYIGSLSLVFITGDVLGSGITLPQDIKDIRDTQLYRTLLANEELTWVTPDVPGMTYFDQNLLAGHYLDSIAYSKNEPVAVIVMELKYKAFSELLATIKTGDNDISYLIAPNKTVISPLSYEETLEFSERAVFEEVIGRSVTVDADTFRAVVDGTDMLVTYDRCDESGFIYMSTIPEADVLQGSRDIRNSTLLLGIVFGIISVIIGLLVSVKITRALKDVVGTMIAASKGDLTVKAKSDSKDEIGSVADTFNTMVKSIRELILQSKEVSNMVHGASESLADITEQTSMAATDITGTISDVADGAEQQSKKVHQSVEVFSELADEIDNVVESTNDMDLAAQNVKDYTVEGIEIAEVLNGKAIEVNQITSQVVDQIADLGNSISGINEITGILNEISDQTKLLSLNASIEAARAGEFGLGFSVVAEEIRKLAEQSSQQTSQIEELAANILSKTNESTEFVRVADAAIKEQAESMKESATYFSKIDYATDDLLKNIYRIMDVIHKIDTDKNNVLENLKDISEVSQMSVASSEEVAASTEEQLAALEELNSMAKKLNNYTLDLEESMKKFLL